MSFSHDKVVKLIDRNVLKDGNKDRFKEDRYDIIVAIGEADGDHSSDYEGAEEAPTKPQTNQQSLPPHHSHLPNPRRPALSPRPPILA